MSNIETPGPDIDSTAAAVVEEKRPSDSVLAPFGYPVFRRIWGASLMSNFGMLIQGVGAAWAMTQMTTSPQMVALVQTAAMMPLMLLSIVSGAAADTYDRRTVSLFALSIGFLGAAGLGLLSFFDLLNPWLILVFSFVIGSGMAIFSPAWQASVQEQVPKEVLPSAIALNGISYNIARSFGPAIGGVMVATVGAFGAFATNAICYLPLAFILFNWRRKQDPARFPPEGVGRAVVSGVRYVLHSPPIVVTLLRTLLLTLIGSSIHALLPLVARETLHAGAGVYGVLLGAFGFGAVVGAAYLRRLRQRYHGNRLTAICALVMGAGAAVAAVSPWTILTVLALAPVGAAWMLSMTIFNVSVQMSAPRWVTARALATYQTVLAAGIAFGSWYWGDLAATVGVGGALLISALAQIVTLLAAWKLKIPEVDAHHEDASATFTDPEVRLGITERSGPVLVEMDYEVDPLQARDFYRAMQQVQMSRQRYGAYGWSIARDIADPALWTERYYFPTWLDYLRQRSRTTIDERSLHTQAQAFHQGPEPIRVRRMLERPFGSVRWREDVPDSGPRDVAPQVGP